MSSFYGGGGGGASSTNYDKLKNTPVTNIGTSTTTTVLAGLDYKHYNLRGNYKATTTADEVTNSEELDVMVVKDEETGNKSVFFFTVENNELTANTYIFDNYGTLLQHKKHSLSDVAHAQWEDMESFI